MDLPPPLEPASPTSFIRDRAGSIIATGTVLALLYLGRDVLVPITLAVILSLAISPLVHALRRVGLGQTVSVLVAVLGLAVVVTTLAAALGLQVVRMTASLPQYEATIRNKLSTLNAVTVGKLNDLSGEAGRILVGDSASSAMAPTGAVTAPAPVLPATPLPAPVPSPTRVDVLNSPGTGLKVLENVLSSIWVPLETAGIVLVVLVFLLLEHEAVRDRFIRVAGGSDIRATTIAINDAGERLSRFFVSQFLVNLGVACTVWIGLMIVGLPHAMLWGALAGVLRFVPYVGIWIAALFATLLGAAVAPGWELAAATIALFLIVELLAGQLVEPQLYGHTTGLSPLSVVIAAIFWSWLWGPVGLIVSTPLTLCLLVAGRHIKALGVLDVLLGDSQALTMPQRFYQRALSADSQEIIASARLFLKQNSFAAYCDLVLMPALCLARLDLATGAITPEQQLRVRTAMLSVIGAIAGKGRMPKRARQQASVLGTQGVGRELRNQREQSTGPYQGPLSVPPGSVMLCVGLGSTADDLATELLVRILRQQKIDARHLSLEDLDKPAPPEVSLSIVAAVYLVSAFPSEERENAETVVQRLRLRLPGARVISVFLPGMLLQPGSAADSIRGADRTATSLSQAVQICLSMKPTAEPAGATPNST
jgi:predicted PurR-regulated permease PerM